MLSVFSEFGSNNSVKALLQTLSLYPKISKDKSTHCTFHWPCADTWKTLLPVFFTAGIFLTLTYFSFLTSPMAWCLTSHFYLSIDPSLLVAASPIPSHLCGCPPTPKELFLGPSQTQVCSSLMSFISSSNLQAAPDFHLMLKDFLQYLPPPWRSPALYCQMCSLCPTEFLNSS